MIKLLKILFLTFIFNQTASTSYAEEAWTCDGWAANDYSSKSDPFILRGTYEKYYWKYNIGGLEQSIIIKKVGENKTNFNDIYVSFQGSIQRPYIIKKDNHSESWRGNGFHDQSKSLKLIEFNLDVDNFITNCHRN